MAANVWTRAQVQSLKVGDVLQETIDTRNSQALPDARWGTPRRVVKISYRGDDIHGKAYVGFYTEFGKGATISGSIKEGESRYRPYSFTPGDTVEYAGEQAVVEDNSGNSGTVRLADGAKVKWYWNFDGETVKLVRVHGLEA